MARVKTYFHTPIFTLQQEKSAFEKCTTKTELFNDKSYIKKLYTRLQLQMPLLGTSNRKTLKQPVFFLKTVVFCTTFDIQDDITLTIIREKFQNHTFQKVHRSLSKLANIHINRTTPYKMTAFEKYLKILFFGASFFKIKIGDILNF